MQSKSSKRKQAASHKMMVDKEAIAKLAYGFYVQRGCEDGHDLDDWLKAERVLSEQSARSRSFRPDPPLMRRLEDHFVVR